MPRFVARMTEESVTRDRRMKCTSHQQAGRHDEAVDEEDNT